MPVRKIVDGGLTIAVEDPALSAALAALDRNHDGVVSHDDYRLIGAQGTNGSAAEGALRIDVVHAFRQAGVLRDANQYKAMPLLLKLYPWIQELDRVTTEWNQHRTNTSLSALEFSTEYWTEHVYPYLEPGGRLHPARLEQMAHDVYGMIFGLASCEMDPGLAIVSHERETDGKTHYLCGIEYNPQSIPEPLRAAVATVAAAYTRSITYLLQYTLVKCDDSDCPEADRVYLLKVPYLSTIREGLNRNLTGQWIAEGWGKAGVYRSFKCD